MMFGLTDINGNVSGYPSVFVYGANGKLKFLGGGGGGGTVTSVALAMPSAFAVAGSPIVGAGTFTVTGAGTTGQYIRGDGTLANFPTFSGGGASISYYLNGGTNQGIFSGTTYYEMSKTAVIGIGVDFNLASNGYIASFITDPGDPALLNIPSGNWNFEMYFSASSSGGSPNFYLELYKYDGAIFTLIASSSLTPEGITNGTAIDLYTTALAVPTTTLTVSDRLAVRVYVNNSGRTLTLHTQDNHLCQIITTFTTGITALNGLTQQVQTFATGTTGTDFAISSSGSIHTFNIPTASALNRGLLSTSDWSNFNGKKSIATGNAYKFETTDAAGNLQETTVTASRAVVTDANGLPAASATTATQIGYLSTTTSDVQTQLNNITGATRHYLLASNFSLTTAIETDITGYAATVDANSYYDVDISLYTGLTGGSTGIKFGFKFPTSSNYRIAEIGRTTGSTAVVVFGSAYTANTGLMALTYNTAAQAAGMVMMKAVLVTGANAGTFQMTMASASGVQTSTIFKNSLMKLTKFTPQP